MFSVIIPLYNKASTVVSTLESVFAQTCQDFEIIVVDDGSEDGSSAVAERFEDPRLRLIRQENRGVSAARNRGVSEARGSRIAFLDADDLWLPEYLALQSALLQDFPGAGLYATAYLTQREGQRFQFARYRTLAAGHRGLVQDYFALMSGGPVAILPSGCVIPRAVFEASEGFPVGEKLGEDQRLWAELALRHTIVFLAQPAIVYREDVSHRASANFPVTHELLFSRYLKEQLEQGLIPPSQQKSVRMYLTFHLMNVFRDQCGRGRWQSARRTLADPALIWWQCPLLLLAWLRYRKMVALTPIGTSV